MREQSCIFFDNLFTAHTMVSLKYDGNTTIHNNYSQIATIRTTYRAQFVIGEDYDTNTHKSIYDCLYMLFLKICEFNNIPTNPAVFDIGAIKKKAKNKNTYRFNLIVSNDELNEIIRDSIITQINIEREDTCFINKFLTKYLEGKLFDDDSDNMKVLSKFQDTTPEDVICVIHLFNTVEKDPNKVLKAIGKLYMDSESMRVNKNKCICHDYIIEGSTACHIFIDRSSEDQNFEHESGNGIEIRLPANIESGFVRYLREIARFNGLSTIIDQAIRVIDNISDSIKDVPKPVLPKFVGRKIGE